MENAVVYVCACKREMIIFYFYTNGTAINNKTGLIPHLAHYVIKFISVIKVV